VCQTYCRASRLQEGLGCLHTLLLRSCPMSPSVSWQSQQSLIETDHNQQGDVVSAAAQTTGRCAPFASGACDLHLVGCSAMQCRLSALGSAVTRT